MMNQDDDQDVIQSHCFDPFPEPRTIPAGWDMSTLLSALTTDSVQQADDTSETESN